MVSKILLILLVLFIPIVLVVVSYFLFNYLTAPHACNLDGKQSELCCEKNGNFFECDKNTLKCGQTISIQVNVSKFSLPNFYFVCSDNLKLNGSSINSTNYLINESGNRQFACLNHLIRSDYLYAFSNQGIIPNASGQVSLIGVYLYSVDPRAANFSSSLYNDISYFISQKGGNKIFEIDGIVKC